MLKDGAKKEQSYKDTLNLPTTKFPMKANLATKELETLKFWESLDIYNKIQAKTKGREQFILNDGPPYANGHLHIGHALNKVLKDIIVKSKNFSGYNAPFIPGWDCHGLPIELNVEKKYGKPGAKLTAQEFRDKCREYANSQIKIQKEEFKRLGVFGDWEKPYLTMQPNYEANIIRTLAKIIERGHLHKGERPVHWCLNCSSSLAEAEVEYKDKKSDSIYVLFKAVDTVNFAKAFNNTDANKQDIYVAIWTTTPWTLPANEAVTLGAELEYSLINFNGKNLVIATELVAQVLSTISTDANKENPEYKTLATTLGKNLELTKLQHPFYNKQVPVILGDHVSLDGGTGCVHTAPAHGQDDYAVGLKYKLPLLNPVGANGCFLDDIELVAGLHVSKANAEIIKILQDNSTLLFNADIMHSYPHCWRHKTPIIFRATPQWFISMEQKDLRSNALKAIKNDVQWIPEWGQARIEAMINNRPDWCISRQRTWGTPISLFIHKDTGNIHPNTVELMERVAQLVDKDGIDAWHNLDINEFLGDDAKDYVKANDTLDVWFDSGAAHFCVGDYREELKAPANLYLEGSDQHRGWFQTSLLSSIAMKDVAPFKQVLTHGFTVDEQGRKMSKSLGNVMSPDKVAKTLGIDILRLWVTATDYRYEINSSEAILKSISDTYRRIRNTARFLLSNLADFEPQKDLVVTDKMIALDKWVVAKAKQLQEEIIENYNEYNFHAIFKAIHDFCAIDLGSFYLDIIKDRQYTCKSDGVARRSSQTAMYHLVHAMVRWLAPIISFTAEEIWQYIPGKTEESVFLTSWYNEFPDNLVTADMDNKFWEQVLLVRDAVNKVIETKRANGNIGSALEAEVTLYCNDAYNNLLKLADELRFVLITSTATVKKISDKPDSELHKVDDNLFIEIKQSNNLKCERCWHRRADVNANVNYPNICSRCVTNLEAEAGEIRQFA